MTVSLFPVAGKRLTAQQVQDKITVLYGATLFWEDKGGNFQDIFDWHLIVSEWSGRNPAGSQVTQGGDLGAELDGMNRRWRVAVSVLLSVVTVTVGTVLGVALAHWLGVF